MVSVGARHEDRRDGIEVTDLLLAPRPDAPAPAGVHHPAALALAPRQYGTLSSVAATFRDLRARLPAQRPSRARLDAVLEALDTRNHELTRVGALASLDAAAVASTGTLAALRRVSRDNLPMSTLVDRAARALRAALADLGVTRVHVGPAADIDRPSLKVYARAALQSAGATWSWGSAGAGHTGMAEVADDASPWLAERARFLHRIGALTGAPPQVTPSGAPATLPVGSLAGACLLLADMNYDACHLWMAQALPDPLPDDTDVHRFSALLATNTGMDAAAETHLRAAYRCAPWPTKRANVAYALALIWAKRLHDLDASDHWLAEAMRDAERQVPGDPGDPQLEQGWILNGFALNTLLRARIDTGASAPAFRRTFAYVRDAFARVERGDDPERVYLRFNLLGNMSTLLAIEGAWDHALRLLDEAFLPLLEAFDDAELVHLQSERAALLAQSGRPDEALALYRSARDTLLEADRPLCAERLNRSAGTLERRAGDLAAAEETFAAGVHMALEARSRPALSVNASGLAVCLAEQGRHREAGETVALAAAEGVDLGDASLAGRERLDSIPPPESLTGLSTSLPEVDLEHLPPASIAGALRGSARDLRVLRGAR